MIRIDDVEIVPNPVTINQGIVIRVKASEANWNDIKTWYNSWGDLKVKLLNWQTLKDL